ncbi:C40 family peptidase [Aquimarina agarilytica]|uniref:C40 family peptidase n=1 Tax=Aquimarina agarilytica TaxID=1087449 RepID=UPI0002884EC8|nr:C40 family peptidase [Aquimarina agarilytica]
MKTKVFLLISLLISLTSCGSLKKSNSSHRKSSINPKAIRIVQHAKSYIGTRYKYGGTTKRGMDCSGLVYTSFGKENIVLPRTSAAMSTKGKPVKRQHIKKGDLVFFKTGKSFKRINHVGVVSKVSENTIFFIHSSSSKGVIESSLSTNYWAKSFRYAKRILPL